MCNICTDHLHGCPEDDTIYLRQVYIYGGTRSALVLQHRGGFYLLQCYNLSVLFVT